MTVAALTIAELAQRTGHPADVIRTVLEDERRRGTVTRTTDGAYHLTPAGRALHAGALPDRQQPRP